jgi:hypothetical protein
MGPHASGMPPPRPTRIYARQNAVLNPPATPPRSPAITNEKHWGLAGRAEDWDAALNAHMWCKRMPRGCWDAYLTAERRRTSRRSVTRSGNRGCVLGAEARSRDCAPKAGDRRRCLRIQFGRLRLDSASFLLPRGATVLSTRSRRFWESPKIFSRKKSSKRPVNMGLKTHKIVWRFGEIEWHV